MFDIAAVTLRVHIVHIDRANTMSGAAITRLEAHLDGIINSRPRFECVYRRISDFIAGTMYIADRPTCDNRPRNRRCAINATYRNGDE